MATGNPEVFYYNLTITNSTTETSGQIYGPGEFPVPAQITAKNNKPIIERPEDYYCSIIRFAVPGASIPLSTFLVKTPVANVNDGIYSFTLDYQATTSGQVFLQYQPEADAKLAPVPPTGTAKQTFNRYYFIYYWQTWADMINAALKTCVNTLNTLNPGLNCSYPFFYYNPDNQLITFYGEKQFFDPTVANPVKIYFNEPMSLVLFPMPYYSYDYGVATGKDKLLVVSSNNGVNDITLNSKTYIKNEAPYSDFGYNSSLKNIIISTGMNVDAETYFINNPSSLQNINNIPILTDFYPDVGLSYGNAGKTQIYNAPSLYRVFSFNGKNPIYDISAGVYWIDKWNNIFPLSIKKGIETSIKFMFIRKDVFKKFIS